MIMLLSNGVAVKLLFQGVGLVLSIGMLMNCKLFLRPQYLIQIIKSSILKKLNMIIKSTVHIILILMHLKSTVKTFKMI